MAEQDNEYAVEYSDASFWQKAKTVAINAGKDVIGKGLQCYYVLQEEDVPKWAKATVVGALGYFISPIDAIPDITPIVGYTDDLGVMTLALATVAIHVTDDVKAKVKAKLVDLFGA